MILALTIGLILPLGHVRADDAVSKDIADPAPEVGAYTLHTNYKDLTYKLDGKIHYSSTVVLIKLFKTITYVLFLRIFFGYKNYVANLWIFCRKYV